MSDKLAGGRMTRLLYLLFGCRHLRYGWPRTEWLTRRRSRTYVVCLECGAKLPYSWESMKRVA